MSVPASASDAVVFLTAVEQEVRLIIDELSELSLKYHQASGAVEFCERFCAAPWMAVIAEEQLQPNVALAIVEGLSAQTLRHDPLLIVLCNRDGRYDISRDPQLDERVQVLCAARPLDRRSLASMLRLGISARNRQRVVRNYLLERNQILQSLGRSEEQLRLVLKSGRITTWSHELGSSEVMWAEGAEQVFGAAVGSLGASVDELVARVHPFDRDEFIRTLRKVESEGVESSTEFRIFGSGGEDRWIYAWHRPMRDPSGKTTRIVSVAIDVTERKRMESALSVSAKRLDMVMSSNSFGMWCCDLPFNVLDWDEACKVHFGLPPDARVTIETFFDRLHPDDRIRVRDSIERSIQDNLPYDVIFRTISPDRKLRWIRAVGKAFYDAGGKPERFDGITIDVTEQKRVEELLKLNDRRKDEFLAMLGHELRNPLAAISNAVNLMQLDDLEASDSTLAIEIMDRQIQQMTRLIDDLLDVARVTRGKITLHRHVVEASELLRRAVETCRPLIDERKHRLTVFTADVPMCVDVDPTRIEQVLTNLLNNAAKYTEENGEIWLSAVPENGEVAFRVKDTGHGMAPEMIESAFELFAQADQTLDRSQGGLGIGLTMVKSLVEMHGGSVRVESPGLEQGCEFTVRLPQVQDEAEVIASEEAPAVPRHSSSARVLVVEDNPDSAASLHLLLRQWGYTVRTVHDGPAALAAAKDYLPQIALLDIGLPGMDGYEVARLLREQNHLTLRMLVAVTGYGREEDFARSKDAGFDYHITKPVKPSALESLLASI